MKAIAFHLPQYHPIPENDRWWGTGFTEWTNVTRAAPLFDGHWQPHLPADLGFYDLRLPEVRAQQASLAQRYGIHGFCYYHYWHLGKRLLHRPLDEILGSGRPSLPFSLCWANHNWTRAWDDGNHAVLIEQRYSMADHLEHIRWLCRVFLDERYIRIDGKPLFLMFRASKVPGLLRVVDLWRRQARLLGVGELFLAELESQAVEERMDPRCKGLDATVEFQPDFATIAANQSRCAVAVRGSRAQQLGHHVFDYAAMTSVMRSKPRPDHRYFRCVTPGWDNTARRQRAGNIVHGSTPELYRDWLSAVLQEEAGAGAGERVVFLNAWNEWAEGNHLEPCQRWGHAYLQATRWALEGGADLSDRVVAPGARS